MTEVFLQTLEKTKTDQENLILETITDTNELTPHHIQSLAVFKGKIYLIEELMDIKEFLIDSLTEEEDRK